jgi:flagellar biosynthesis chaperone FliJ
MSKQIKTMDELISELDQMHKENKMLIKNLQEIVNKKKQQIIEDQQKRQLIKWLDELMNDTDENKEQ